MKPYSKYNTHPIKKRVPMFLAIALLAGMVALNVFVPVPEPDADRVCPMANAHVTWLDSFHAGAWGDAE